MEIVKFVRRHAAMGWAAALYVLFLYPLFGRKTGFLFGDYGLQFYPWMKVYADGLRAHALPLWTPLIQSGFPLFAEGQTGMLYLPNLVLFSLLPFKAAYNAMFLLHYFLGGLFSYLFARRRRLSPEASALVSLCFTFGSAYAGSFYNIVTLRSLVWFPLLLLFVERFIETRRLRPLAGLAFFMGQSWLAGFPQTSLYLFF
ncbi:MAG TPA: hypothetical protein VL404_03915, partial [Candidatus Eisenbacteria bacterium]|nr:hypothetical protein [Candidatus Eisenbacteria bacterium]